MDEKRAGELRKHLELATRDLSCTLLYYDRKDDEELGREDLRELVVEHRVTYAEIVAWFSDELAKDLRANFGVVPV